MELKFECPTCGQHLSATSEQIGLTAACPNCNSSVTVPARPDDDQAVFVLPTKLPFLKSHRKKILEAKVSELVSLGPMSQSKLSFKTLRSPWVLKKRTQRRS